jgi:hypothetical protein
VPNGRGSFPVVYTAGKRDSQAEMRGIERAEAKWVVRR